MLNWMDKPDCRNWQAMQHCSIIFPMKPRKAKTPLWRKGNPISVNFQNSRNMSNAKAWLEALRLRTLPLALASTGMGNFLAVGFKVFDWRVCVLSSLTAVLLQILSNLANDYG